MRLLSPILATSAIGLATLLVLTSHIVHGGLYSDDWGFAGDYIYVEPPRYFTAVRELIGLSGGRPLLALLHPLPYALFGTNAVAHLALSALLSALVANTFYVLLRTLGIGLIDAVLIALLALLFPWADSTKLWPTAAINNFALLFLLLGVLVALRSIHIAGRRGYVLHAAAAFLYVLGVLTYEAVAAAAIFAGVLYVGRAPRRRALGFWAIDGVALVGALAYDWIATASARGVPGFRARVGALDDFARQTATLVARSLYPAASSKTAREILLVCIAMIATIAFRKRHDDVATRRWLRVAGMAALTIAAAYAAIVGSALLPLSSGVGNRGNMLAALGFATLTYAIVRLAALVALPRRPLLSATVSAFVAIALVAWYAKIVRHDAALWDRAADRQEQILDGLRRAVPSPARGTTIYLLGSAPEVAPGIPIFSEIWDLNGAVKVLYDDGSLRAFPVSQGGLHCGPHGVPRRLGLRFNEADTAYYGHIIAFDARTGTATKLRTEADCREARAHLAGLQPSASLMRAAR